jgi:hypothetical protein
VMMDLITDKDDPRLALYEKDLFEHALAMDDVLASLRSALSELAGIREREKTSVAALRQFLFSFDAVVKKSGYKAALTKLSIAKQGARRVLALLEGRKEG